MAVLTDGAVRQLAEPVSVLRRPADATVAKLIGYDNVIPVETDRSGPVLVGGVPCDGLTGGRPGPGVLAVWATAIRVSPAGGGDGLVATVEKVAAGPGRWEVVLSGPAELRAHLPLDHVPPREGERVAVEIEPSGATVIGASPPV